MSVKEFERLIARELEENAELIKKAGIKAETESTSNMWIEEATMKKTPAWIAFRLRQRPRADVPVASR